MGKTKEERQKWWRSLTLSEQADFVEKKMRQQGKTPDRDWVIKDLVMRGQYVGSNKREIIKHDIEETIRSIHDRAIFLRNLLSSLDTDTIESLGIYEYGGRDSIRFNFFHTQNLLSELSRYFHDEEWAQWQTYRESERKNKEEI